MGRNKKNNKNSSPSRPKPSSSTLPSSTVDQTSDDMVSADRAVVAIMKRSYGKAQKIVKEALAKHKNSAILHRVNASLHFKLATLLKESAAKLKPLKESANSTHKATILSPNSLSFSRLHVSMLVELSKLTKEYDTVIQECDRGLSITNPIDSVNDLKIDDVDFQGVELSLEARIKNARNDIAKYKNSMNIIKILDVDGEERIMYRSIDERHIKKDNELKEIIKKKKELENKIEEIVNLQKKLSNASEKRSLTLEKIVGKAKKTARVREYWKEMSYESKKKLLEVRIDEVEQHFEKDDVARETLMEAIGYAKEKGKWKFWECCFCGEKFVDCEMGMNHYEEVHVGVLSEELESVVPGKVSECWVNAIQSGDWRPVNIPVASKTTLNKSNSDEGWPLSDDTERANILHTMQCLLKLFVGNKCLTESLLKRVVEYARGQLNEDYELDKSLHCYRFLTVPELNSALEIIQDMYALCDLDGLMKDEDIDNPQVVQETIDFSSDFKCLLLDERLLQENITVVDDRKDDVSDEIITVGEDGSGATFAISENMISWLFCIPIEEQIVSWTQLRGTKVFEVPDSDFSKLKSLCERKCDHNDYRTAASAIKRLILEEDAKRKQFPESEMQTDMSLLRERRKELIERDGDAVFRSSQLQLDVIRDILEDSLSISFDQIRSEEVGQMMQDCLYQANRYTRAAFERFYMGLMDEAVKIEVMIVRHIAAMEKFKLKLRRVCAYDYRSIMLPFLKLFIKAQLEDLVDKDASEKSAAAHEALLAELALDVNKNIGKGGDHAKQGKPKSTKKKKDRKKSEFKESGGNKDLLLHQVEDAEQVDVPVASASTDGLKEQEEELRHKIELEERLDEYLENQRRFEIEAKEKHLSEQNVVSFGTIPVNMTEGVPDKQVNSEVSEVSSSYYEKSQQDLLVDETGIPKVSSGFPIKGTMGKSSSASTTQWREKRNHSNDKLKQGPPNQGKPEGALPSDQRKGYQDCNSGDLLTETEVNEGGSLQIEGSKKTFQEQEDFPLKEEQKLPEKASLEGEEFGPLPTDAEVNDKNKSIGVGTGLKNDIGCVLNVNIQSLWNLRRFRDEFMAVPESMHNHDVGDPCVVCELQKIFSHLSISATEMQKEAVDPTSLKLALGSLQPSESSFIEATNNDASQVLEFIFESLHQSNSGFAASVAEIEGKRHLCHDCTSSLCLVHKLFGLSILKKMNCDNCYLESGCRKYITYFHKINAGELRRMKRMHGYLYFDELLKHVVMNHEFACPSKEGGCGNLNHIRHILFTLPHFFTTVLGWETNSENEDDISETLRALTAEIDVGLLYPNLVPGYKYCIVSMVCYHLLHYICFAYSHERKTWIMYDDEIVKAIGCWGDVLNKCKEELYQPQVLFFEAVSQFKDIKLEPTCTYRHNSRYTLGG